MVFIYALIDPFTFKVRYIGKTANLKQRLQRQCTEKTQTYRCNWIQGVIKQGRKPIQVILQELTELDNWQECEKKWILIARKYKWPLVNCTDGGDGVTNLSGESKNRMLRTWLGRKHKPETLLKLSKSSKGRIKSDSSKDLLSEKMKGRKIDWKDKIKVSVRKFTPDKVTDIQYRISQGEKVKDLALEFGVHRTTLSKIKNNQYETYQQKTRNYRKQRRYDHL